MRAWVAIGLELAFFSLAFGWRSWVQWRRTGSTGFIRPRRGAPPAELAGATGFVVALVLLVPNVLSVAALLILAVALEVQVRLVEEPYLHATHGSEYARYQTSAGRFLPGIGTTATP